MNILLNAGECQVEFSRKGGGFPTKLSLPRRDGSQAVLMESACPLMSMQLADGRTIYPTWPEGLEPNRSSLDNSERLEFEQLPWIDGQGCLVKGFSLSLQYEFHPDGAVFVNSFFLSDQLGAPAVKSMKLSYDLDLSSYPVVHYSYLDRPASTDAYDIMFTPCGRFLERGLDNRFPGRLVPMIDFHCRSDNESAILEFFLEGDGSLSGKRAEVESGVTWEHGNPRLSWDFQTEEYSNDFRTYQWRNTWGFVIAPPPRKRHLPPMRIYHFLDNVVRYPDDRLLEKIRANGGDVLIIHENWRLDVQNGGIPYERKTLERVIATCHRIGMRVLLYVRGNELSILEDGANWFNPLLQKDYDGLYMDFGGPVHFTAPQEISFPGGRIQFRRFHQKQLSLRRLVGANGVFFSHTGPAFAALGMTGGLVDGYVSGECENGVMLNGLPEHEYFSSAYAVLGTLWTAAFPEYCTGKIIPFLLATGQAPHIPLGVQISSSCLTHPPEPGLRDHVFRPLWKLWGLAQNRFDWEIFTSYNSSKVLENAVGTVSYMMCLPDRSTVLLLIGNASDKKSMAEVKVNWQNVGFKIETAMAYQVTPTLQSPGGVDSYSERQVFKANLDGYGVTGFLLSQSPQEMVSLFAEYIRPYPLQDDADREYLSNIEEQRRIRGSQCRCGKLFLKISTPLLPYLKEPFEEPLFFDLYNNVAQLGIIGLNGDFQKLGWISSSGFCHECPEIPNRIFPGYASGWIPLHEILPSGKHQLGVKSFHGDSPFYSFYELTLASEAADSCHDKRLIKFFNEIDADRSLLQFDVEL